MGSRSTGAQVAVVALAVAAGLLTWLLQALLDGVVFAQEATPPLTELLLHAPLQTWVERIVILLVFIIIGVIAAGLMPVEEVVDEEAPQVVASDTEKFARDAEIMILGLDVEGRIQFFNRRCEAVTGYTADEIIGESFFDVLLPPRSLPTMVHAVTSVVEEGTRLTQETAWITNGGHEIIISSECAPVHDEAGKIVGVAVSASEITEFRWSEADIQQARQPYRPLAETMMGDGLTAFDPGGNITWANESLAQMIGRERDELEGMPVVELAREAERERLSREIENCLETGDRMEVRIIAATGAGEEFPAAVTAVAVEQPEGQTTGGFATIRDISDIVPSDTALTSRAGEPGEADTGVDPAEIEKLEAELSDANERAEAAYQEARAEFEDELERLQEAADEAERGAREARENAAAEQSERIQELEERLRLSENRLAEAREQTSGEQQERIEQLERQLRDSEERFRRARQTARAEHEDIIADLRDQIAHLEARLETAGQQARAEQQVTIEGLRERLEAAESEMETARTEAREEGLVDGRAEVEDLREQLAGAQDEAQQAQSAIREEYEERVEELSGQLEQAEARIDAARREAQVDRDDEVEALRADLAEAEERIDAAREEGIAEDRSEIEELEQQLAGARDQVEQAQVTIREEYEGRVAQLEAEVAEREERIAQAREEGLAEGRSEVEELREQLAEARDQTEQAQATVREEYEGRVEELEAQVAARENRIEEAREEGLAEGRSQVAELEQQLAEARNKAQQAQFAIREEYEERVAQLEAEVAEREERIEEAREEGRAEGRSEVEELEQQLAEVRNEAQQAQATIREEYEGRVEELEAQVAARENRIEKAREEGFAEGRSEVEDLREQLAEAQDEAQQAQATIREEYEGRVEELSGQLENADERIEQARASAWEEAREDIEDLHERVADAELEAEGARRDREIKLGFMQQLFDGIPYPVLVIGPDGVVQSCNEAFAERLLGAPPTDIIDSPVDGLGGQAGDELVQALTRQNAQILEHGGEESFEAELRVAGGANRTYAFNKEASVGPDGEITGVICALLDISGVEEARQELEEERKEIATVLDRTPAVVAEIRPDGTTAAVYGACERTLGWTADEMVGRDWWQTLFPGELREPIRDVLGAMRGGGDLHDEALTTQTADGDRRVISWSSSNARGPNRELLSILLVGHDITNRAKAEQSQQLRLSEALERNKRYACLCNALRLTQDPQLSLNEIVAGIVASIPQAWRYPGITTASITVYDREREAGDSPTDPVARQRAEIVVNSEAVGEIEVRYHEERPELADGPFTSGERDLLNVLAERIGDTIERRSAEDSRARLLQFRQSLVEQANVWLMALDRERNVVEWNRTAEEISGYSRQEVLGHDDVWKMLFPKEETRREVTREVARITFGTSIAENWETAVTCKDGAECVISWNCRQLLEDDGTAIGAVFLGREVTEEADAAASSEA